MLTGSEPVECQRLQQAPLDWAGDVRLINQNDMCKPCSSLPSIPGQQPRFGPNLMNMDCGCYQKGQSLPYLKTTRTNYEYEPPVNSEYNDSFCYGIRPPRHYQPPLRICPEGPPLFTWMTPNQWSSMCRRRPIEARSWNLTMGTNVGGGNTVMNHEEYEYQKNRQINFPNGQPAWLTGRRRIDTPTIRGQLYLAPEPIRDFWRDRYYMHPCKMDNRVRYQPHERDPPDLHNFNIYRSSLACERAADRPFLPPNVSDVHKLRYASSNYMSPDDWYQ